MPTDRPQPDAATERQIAIGEQLARLQEQLGAYTRATQQTNDLLVERLNQFETKLEKIEHKIVGNGNDGIIIRLDRLEQSEMRRSRTVWLALTASVTAIIAVAVKWLTTGN